MKFKVGDKVVFDACVYVPPYAPYYDPYRGYTFEIVKFHYNKTHVELKCVDGNVKVRGYVHPHELVLVTQ